VVTVSELTMPKLLRLMVTCAELPLMIAVSNSPGTPESQLVHVVDVCQSPVPVARHVSSAAEVKPMSSRGRALLRSRSAVPACRGGGGSPWLCWSGPWCVRVLGSLVEWVTTGPPLIVYNSGLREPTTAKCA
jgi:hypothetical protein